MTAWDALLYAVAAWIGWVILAPALVIIVVLLVILVWSFVAELRDRWKRRKT